MKVILLQDVKGVGKRYEVKDVSDGYGRNFLIGRKLAEAFTSSTTGKLNALRIKAQNEVKSKKEKEDRMADSLRTLQLHSVRKANELGHLFDTVGKDDVRALLELQKLTHIDLVKINLHERIKSLGEHKVEIEVGEHKIEVPLIVENES